MRRPHNPARNATLTMADTEDTTRRGRDMTGLEPAPESSGNHQTNAAHDAPAPFSGQQRAVE